jgi:hypothetical protein
MNKLNDDQPKKSTNEPKIISEIYIIFKNKKRN